MPEACERDRRPHKVPPKYAASHRNDENHAGTSLAPLSLSLSLAALLDCAICSPLVPQERDRDSASEDRFFLAERKVLPLCFHVEVNNLSAAGALQDPPSQSSCLLPFHSGHTRGSLASRVHVSSSPAVHRRSRSPSCSCRSALSAPISTSRRTGGHAACSSSRARLSWQLLLLDFCAQLDPPTESCTQQASQRLVLPGCTTDHTPPYNLEFYFSEEKRALGRLSLETTKARKRVTKVARKIHLRYLVTGSHALASLNEAGAEALLMHHAP